MFVRTTTTKIKNDSGAIIYTAAVAAVETMIVPRIKVDDIGSIVDEHSNQDDLAYTKKVK